MSAHGLEIQVAASAHTHFRTAPTLTSVSKSLGPVRGGQTITIDGSNFKVNAQLTVQFAGASNTLTTTTFTSSSSTQLVRLATAFASKFAYTTQ